MKTKWEKKLRPCPECGGILKYKISSIDNLVHAMVICSNKAECRFRSYPARVSIDMSQIKDLEVQARKERNAVLVLLSTLCYEIKDLWLTKIEKTREEETNVGTY